ncbi:MAG TPA: flagellar motor stator protein MotA [Ignavibacteriaceae bacterium]|nr:flagellar motor stator protein MotA [Ignavibacteriaceae bacterium]
MFVIIGIAVVFVSVIVGFMIAGGNLLVLLQWAEFLIIGGAAFGSLLISAPPAMLKKIFAAIPRTFSSHDFNKDDYLKLLKSFYELFLIAQRDGFLAIEKHIESPKESEILSANPKFMENEEALSFFCDTLKVILTGGLPPHEVEEIMDISIETYEAEQKPIAGQLAKVGDALPGLGIVAAVLGIIVTMGSIDAGAAEVGKHVAAALVGTFLGVLLSYGLVNPLASNIEHKTHNDIRYLETIKACVVAYTKGNPPIVAVEISRRTINSDHRPTFVELENFLRNKKE